jgi:hypothetical protein
LALLRTGKVLLLRDVESGRVFGVVLLMACYLEDYRAIQLLGVIRLIRSEDEKILIGADSMRRSWSIRSRESVF